MSQVKEEVQELITTSIKAYCGKKGFVEVNPTIKTNVNGYPFVTFINDSNEAENIYFSKRAGLGLTDGQPIGDVLKGKHIAETTNAEGEIRMKIVSQSRVSIADVL